MSFDNSSGKNSGISDHEALLFHQQGKPGKLEVVPTKPMATQRDLSLAYSPGVAVPVNAIAENADYAYDYTSKGNLVAVISNGTAILGLGNLGALASKPVMEGKAVLFKRFADVDSIDLEVDAEEIEEFIASVRHLGPSFGGINLEDIKAPDCFVIEQRLREEMNIPVFHDDQHGTAIISAAGLLNALHLTGKKIEDIKLVCNGAGAAGIACLELAKAMGLPHNNAILCDTKGVIYKGREEGMNQWKSAHAAETEDRTLEDAMKDADVVFGLSVKGAFSADMIKSMADKPIIFAMANPDPEILPEEVKAIRDDAIIATGRSDYPNQVNNVLGFPYIFRGALDVRATTINDQMKIAAAEAIASLAREDVPDEVANAYNGPRPQFGPDYIIPVPFDPRLISFIPPAVAKAAMDSGVAQKTIIDIDKYVHALSARLDPIAGTLREIYDKVKARPKRVVFAEGEEDRVIRAANAYMNNGLGQSILIGREAEIERSIKEGGLAVRDDLEIVNSRLSDRREAYADHLYSILQRQGYLFRDCTRMVNNDRNIFAALMVAMGDADAMITGVTRNYSVALQEVLKVITPAKGHKAIGTTMVLGQNETVFVADTTFYEFPTAEDLADISIEAASVARRLGFEPRVALLSYSTFGHPKGERSDVIKQAVEVLDSRAVDFEYEGEMSADIALNMDAMSVYQFSRLTQPANVLIMPGFHSASIATKMLQEIGGVSTVGPLISGLEKSIQIVPLNATATDLLNMAVIAAHDING